MSKNIIRVEKNADNPYVMMNKLFLSDTRLSWKAKGLLSYLLSKPDNWKIIIESLIKESTDGERAVRSALNELKEFNYIQRYPVFKDKVIDHWESIVYEQPYEGEKIKSISLSENEEEQVNLIENTPQTVKTPLLVRNVDVGNVDVGNAGLLINDFTNKDLTKIKEEVKPVVKRLDVNKTINEYTNNPQLKTTLIEFLDMRRKQKDGITDTAITKMLTKLTKIGKTDAEKIEILDNSIMCSYKGIFPLKVGQQANACTPKRSQEFGNAY